jgi:hypothetical protein
VSSTDRLQELRAEARYQRERYDLYRARAYAGKPVSDTRMRELGRLAAGAEERLQAARHAAAA